jgi:hypothetical protein
MRDMGKCIEDIMKEEIQTQVYDAYKPKYYERTNQFIDSVKITDVSNNRVEVSWRDNGNWYSVVKRAKNEQPDHMYVIHGHEMGKVWGREGEPTNLVEESTRRAEYEVPDELIKSLRSKGINVRRK